MRLVLACAASAAALSPFSALRSDATLPAFHAALNSTRLGAATLQRLGATPSQLTAPQQLHLAPGAVPGSSLSITWVTAVPLPEGCLQQASYWPADGSGSSQSADAESYTYSAGVGGWHGQLHSAQLTGLAPGVRYSYTVGGSGAAGAPCSPRSEARAAALPPPRGAPSAYLAVAADMGTIVPLGWAVADLMAEDALEGAQRFDAVVLAGDLAYATVEPSSCSAANPGCDEVEWTWDAFGLQLEPLAEALPLLTAVGNHEHVPGNITRSSNGTAPATAPSAFAAYQARYPMPTPAPGAFWWATDVGPLHLLFLSSEHAFDAASPQWAWAAGDLRALDRGATPWVAVVLHRPVYSAAVLEWEDHCPGGKLAVALEPLLQLGGGVDVVLQGHIHSWERTHPVRNGTVVARPGGAGNATYVNPGAPIYVVQGTSGALPENVFFDPAPAWSAARNLGSFGYGRLRVNASAFAYEYVGLTGAVLDAFAITK
jgi:hypothetical protein